MRLVLVLVLVIVVASLVGVACGANPALGCCSTTAVNRESAAHVKRRLGASGLPECAPKAACGPGRRGDVPRGALRGRAE